MGGESTDFSLNMDFSFLILCVGARPVSVVKLKLKKIKMNNLESISLSSKNKILFDKGRGGVQSHSKILFYLPIL